MPKPDPSLPPDPPPGALAGLTVIECTSGIPGPYAGKLLAGLGAAVIKVEPPGGDPSRGRGPFPGGTPDPEAGGLFHYLNAGKRGVVLDLDQPADRSRLDGLLAGAALLLEDWGRAWAAGAGLAPAALRARHPGLTVASVTPYGCSGPDCDAPATDLTLFHASGMAYETPQHGVPALDLPPLRAGGESGSFLAGMVAAAGALVALLAAERDGRGRHADVAHIEALTSVMLRISLHQFTYEAKRPQRTRHSDRQVNYLPCKDGYVNVQVHQRNWWEGMVAAMGSPGWTRDPLFTQADFRTQGWDILEPLLEEWARQHTKAELFELLQRHHVPCLPGNDFADVLADPHLNARGYFREVDLGPRGRWCFPGAPYRLEVTPWAAGGPAPRLGEHDALLAPPDRAAAAVLQVPAVPAHSPPRLPLEGVRVLDFSWVFAGPTATMLLASAGAEVIKVETRSRPDATRAQRAYSGGNAEPGTGGGFDGLNFSKRSITLNLKDPRAVDIVKRLTALSGVVVQNYARGVMARFGLGYETLRAMRPDLIMLSMTLFGQDGPYRDYFGYGGPLPVFTGLASVTGHPGGTPQTVGASWPDPLNGINATIALLAALRHRNRTGQGQHIDLAMAEGALATLPLGVLETTATGRPPGLMGNRDPRLAPHNSYRCAGDDQWIVVAVENEPQWQALCRATSHPEWAADPRFAGMDARKANEDALDALLAAWCRERDKSAAAALLRAAGVPAAASLDRAEVLAAAHLQERGAFVAIDPSAGGPPRLVPAVPWHIEGVPARYERPPTLGQDTEAVLGDLLGMSTAEIAALRDSGALE